MERITLINKGDTEDAVMKAKVVLEAGGVILYPTDTLYGLGVDALNAGAIDKVFALKGRGNKKPLSVMVSDLKMAKKYVEVGSIGESLAAKVLPGPFTIVFPKKNVLSENLTARESTLGIRIPDSFFCTSLARKFGRPITATSANKAGEEAEANVDEILEQLGEKREGIDLIIDVGDFPQKDPSTVLKINGTAVEILREGNINHSALLNVTKEDKEKL